MALKCQKCQSDHIDTRNYTKKTDYAVGTFAGTATGAAIALSNAELGAALTGPVGPLLGAWLVLSKVASFEELATARRAYLLVK